MAYTDEYLFSGTAVDTTLASDVTGGVSTTISLGSSSGWPSPTAGQLSVATLNYGTSAEVKITYTGKSGSDLTGVTWNFDGTTASGTYAAGTTIRHSISALAMNDADYVKRQTVGKVTAAGDLLYATAANTLARLAKGTARQQLAMNAGATAPEWVASLQSLLTGTGDIAYASAANTLARLAAGTNGHVLTLAGGVPAWAAPSSAVTAQTSRTAGDVTMNSTAAFTADVDTAMDLTVAAVTGDKVELQFHGSVGAEAVFVAFDFVTRVAAADVNFASSGNGTPYTYGIPGSRAEQGDNLSVNASTLYTVQAGDISGGNVTFRLRYKTGTAADRTLYASAGTHARASAKNFGQ